MAQQSDSFKQRVAYVTLLLNDSYLPGALVLARSLRNTATRAEIVILYHRKALTTKVVDQLVKSDLFDRLVPLSDDDLLQSQNEHQLVNLLKRQELSLTMTKLNIWRLYDYAAVCYLDCDILVLGNIDEVFDIPLNPGEIVASSDCGWPDIFNSGVFITKPDFAIWQKLFAFYQNSDSFDGADQGLLNEFFNLQSQAFGTKWIKLPFVYNCTINSNYEYLPALIRFKIDIKVVHFIGQLKPWIDKKLINSNKYPKIFNDDTSNLFHKWWQIYDDLFNDQAQQIEILELAGHLQSRLVVPLLEITDTDVDKVEDEETPKSEDPNIIQNHIDDISKIHFPMYYYKHNSSPNEIVDESSKGEAYKLQESKVQWEQQHQQQKEVDAEEDNEIDQYIKQNPIFPWESSATNNKPTRTFTNLNYQPQHYAIKIMDNITEQSAGACLDDDDDADLDDGDENANLIGFNNGEKFDKYLKKIENAHDTKDTTGGSHIKEDHNGHKNESEIEGLGFETVNAQNTSLEKDLEKDVQLELELELDPNVGVDKVGVCLDDF